MVKVILSSDNNLISCFEVLEQSFFNLLKDLEDLSSEIQKNRLDSKEFAEFLETLYYSRAQLRNIKEKILARANR